MDLNRLYLFYLVCKCGSMSKAAKIAFISQPAISQHIHILENEIGLSLLNRGSKGIKPTNEGLEIYKRLQKFFPELDNLEKLIEDLKNLEYGSLKIGASDTICKYYLIDILKEFENLYPNIKYRVTNCTTAESLERLKNGNVDISFIHSPIKDKEVTLYHCLTLHDCFVCSYEFDCSKIKHLSDLLDYRTLLLENDSYSRILLDECLAKYNVKLKPKFELASLDLLIEFAKKNMGIICVAKEYIKDELANKQLKIIPIEESLEVRYISLAIHNDNYISALTQKFIDHIKKKNS